MKFLRGRLGAALHRDVGIGVGGVADHEHLDVAARDLVEGLALGREDLGVGGQQVGTLHAGAAGTGTDEQGVVGILEGDQRVTGGDHAGEQRERAVFEFHDHALECLLGLLVGDLEQLQDDWLVLAEHFAGGDAEQQGVTDLASGTGDGNANRLFAHGKTPGNGENGAWPRSAAAIRPGRMTPWSAVFDFMPICRFDGACLMSYIRYDRP